MPGGVDAHVHLCQDLKTGWLLADCPLTERLV